MYRGQPVDSGPLYQVVQELCPRSDLPMPRVNEATAHMFIVSPLRGGGIKSLFSTHPPMDERIRRLEAMTLG